MRGELPYPSQGHFERIGILGYLGQVIKRRAGIEISWTVAGSERSNHSRTQQEVLSNPQASQIDVAFDDLASPRISVA